MKSLSVNARFGRYAVNAADIADATIELFGTLELSVPTSAREADLSSSEAMTKFRMLPVTTSANPLPVFLVAESPKFRLFLNVAGSRISLPSMLICMALAALLTVSSK